ncbi:hypothetical protein [Planktothricoides raciborskii]|uniref:Uncharacterized protein n=1 Tax=Planktothricoides raciborskii FACHB-1370 TaxID=2949576 RepID=A0ABR8EC77_9CYAN|nr:hypothetical protein [Planktothricoides raciborskii]MBD2543330.1 hypothetical protein [Planktothricoides raciborskii FACHB-1370]MBD2581630.1 hypothetical protein [Planktothricoides raciborskii FACHB-1261]
MKTPIQGQIKSQQCLPIARLKSKKLGKTRTKGLGAIARLPFNMTNVS